MGSGNERLGRRPRRGETVDDGNVERQKQGRRERRGDPYSFIQSKGDDEREEHMYIFDT